MNTFIKLLGMVLLCGLSKQAHAITIINNNNYDITVELFESDAYENARVILKHKIKSSTTYEAQLVIDPEKEYYIIGFSKQWIHGPKNGFMFFMRRPACDGHWKFYVWSPDDKEKITCCGYPTYYRTRLNCLFSNEHAFLFDFDRTEGNFHLLEPRVFKSSTIQTRIFNSIFNMTRNNNWFSRLLHLHREYIIDPEEWRTSKLVCGLDPWQEWGKPESGTYDPKTGFSPTESRNA